MILWKGEFFKLKVLKQLTMHFPQKKMQWKQYTVIDKNLKAENRF